MGGRTGFDRWTAWRRPALDLLFPRACAGCGCADPEAHRWFCWDCRATVAFVQPPFCRRCGKPTPGPFDADYECHDCTHRRIRFDAARSVARDQGPPAEAVRALKYRGHTWLAPDLADWMAESARAHYGDRAIDGICAVPLHAARRRARGFNQSALLGAALARRLGLEWHGACVRRIRRTRSQTRLTAEQRASNVRGAFRARSRRWLDGRRLLLVDDVMTTGATVDACAAALKAGGAARVWGLTLVRR